MNIEKTQRIIVDLWSNNLNAAQHTAIIGWLNELDRELFDNNISDGDICDLIRHNLCLATDKKDIAALRDEVSIIHDSKDGLVYYV